MADMLMVEMGAVFLDLRSDVAMRIMTHTYMGTMAFYAASFNIGKLLLNKIWKSHLHFRSFVVNFAYGL